MILDEVDPATRSLLERHAFDAPTFERLRADLISGALAPGANVVTGAVEPLEPGELTDVLRPGDSGFDSAVAAGTEALGSGSVAIVVLAGGMATRFGGGVKATAEVIDG